MSGPAPAFAPWETLPHGRPMRPGGLALTKRALDICGFAPGARVLDAGCGTGHSLELLRGKGLTALGIDSSAAQIFKCNTVAHLIRGQAQLLPLRDDSLHGVLSECVLSLLPDPALALAEWNRVLEPGGLLALSDLHALEDPKPRAKPVSCLQGALPLPTQLDLARRAGFEPLLVEDHTPMLKRFAAELVFAGIALDNIWTSGCGTRPRAGYHLLVARKTRDIRHG